MINGFIDLEGVVQDMSEIKQISRAKVDLSKPLKPETYNGVHALYDNGATLVTEVYRNGEAVDLTGCEAVAYFTNAAGKTQNLTGKIDGNTITVFLNTYALDVCGRFTVAIQLQKENIRQTVRLMRGYLYETVAADHWMGAVFKGSVQTGANEVTLRFTPNTADLLIMWEVFEIVNGEYVNQGIAYSSYDDGKYTWEAVLYDVEAGDHEYCLRGTRENLVGEYTKSVNVYVE